MKLRTRVPRPPRWAEEEEEAFDDECQVVDADVEVRAPASRRRPARRSVALSAAFEPTPSRSRPRAAPKGGVQKRKVARPRPRPRPVAAPTPSRSSRRTRPAESLPPPPTLELDEDNQEDHDAAAAAAAEKQQCVAKSAATTTIDDLPEEVMLGIFSYFRPPQLCWKIGRVCRRWASWSVAPFLWRGKEYTLSADADLDSGRKRRA